MYAAALKPRSTLPLRIILLKKGKGLA